MELGTRPSLPALPILLSPFHNCIVASLSLSNVPPNKVCACLIRTFSSILLYPHQGARVLDVERENLIKTVPFAVPSLFSHLAHSFATQSTLCPLLL